MVGRGIIDRGIHTAPLCQLMDMDFQVMPMGARLVIGTSTVPYIPALVNPRQHKVTYMCLAYSSDVYA
jgi:hypothetical protein